MSTATRANGVGYDEWIVYPFEVTIGPNDAKVYRWRCRYAPVYSRAAVRAAFRSQEMAERLARVLTERNEPF
jgi:hypothetical protein